MVRGISLLTWAKIETLWDVELDYGLCEWDPSPSVSLFLCLSICYLQLHLIYIVFWRCRVVFVLSCILDICIVFWWTYWGRGWEKYVKLRGIWELVVTALGSTNRLSSFMHNIFAASYRFMEVELKFPFIEPAIIENNSSASFIRQLTPTVCLLIVLAEWKDAMWRSTGRRCGWETSSGCDVTRSSLLMFCCWAPVTRTVCATSRPPHWTERPTSSRGRSSAASLTWWDGCLSLFVSTVS